MQRQFYAAMAVMPACDLCPAVDGIAERPADHCPRQASCVQFMWRSVEHSQSVGLVRSSVSLCHDALAGVWVHKREGE